MTLRRHGVYLHGFKQPQTDYQGELLSALNPQRPFLGSLLPHHSGFKTISKAFTLCIMPPKQG